MFTYICANCGTNLQGRTDHNCQPGTSSTTFNLHQNCLDERTLREQIAREQKEYLDHWQDFYLDTYPDDVVDCVGRDLIAIARGK